MLETGVFFALAVGIQIFVPTELINKSVQISAYSSSENKIF